MDKQRFIQARRAVIARDLRQLNPMQRQAAMATEGPLLLLAGAGSGKTTVLIQRIYTLLTYGRGGDSEEVPEWATEDDLRVLEGFPDDPGEEDWANARRLCAVDPPRPWEILAITFTNKAAGELKDRLAARLGERGEGVWASTFHSACVRILRRDIHYLGFDRDFTIYDTDDSRRLLRDIIRQQGLDEKAFPPKSVLSAISAAKDRYEDPAEFAARYQGDGADWRMARIAKVYDAYAKRLRSANALDFDDLIFHTVTLLRQEPAVLAYYQDKFRYVLVDEYQDTDRLQYLLTSLLAGGRRNLCVVGDDDQSIYRFRGATIENILDFEKQYPDARTIRLEQNYRSTQNILDAANGVIRHNAGRKGKTLWTDNGGGQTVSIRTAMSEGDEAVLVAGDILSMVRRGGRFRDAAVLYRMNAQSNALEYAMKRDGIPYRVVGGVKFFDRAEVKDILAYLCVVNDPMDDLRLRRIVNVPARGIGAATLEKAAALAGEQGASLYEIFRNADLFPPLKSAAPRLLKFADLVDDLRRAVRTMDLPSFYDTVCQETGYVLALKEKNDLESRGRLENVLELRSNIVNFLEGSPQDGTLAGFLNEIALYTDLDGVNDSDDCVTLMTIHAAKGLEFPWVYVVGMEEGIFPSANAQFQEEDVEEERRLCYVAMTRAKERLTLTNARQRMLYGHTSTNPPSRFLEEIPAENCCWEGREETPSAWGGWGAPASRAVPAAPAAAPASRTAPAAPAPARPHALRQSAPAPLLELHPGDAVEHETFGRGTVESVRPAGHDALVEAVFDAVGRKKLMLRAASRHMKKIR